MGFEERDMYHGAALYQIAEHEGFTAINSVLLGKGKKKSASSFRINDRDFVYLKYATKASKTVAKNAKSKKYQFTFEKQHLEEISDLESVAGTFGVHVVLVIADDKHKKHEICCLKTAFFEKALAAWKSGRIHRIMLYVEVETGKSFDVYYAIEGKRSLGEHETVPKNMFSQSVISAMTSRRFFLHLPTTERNAVNAVQKKSEK